MARDMRELKRDARRGKLTRGAVTWYVNQGLITNVEADELDDLIVEYERHQQTVAGAPAAAPTAVTGGKVYEIGTFVEEIKANRINAGDEVDDAWRDIPELRRLCGRQQPRTLRKVTEGLDPFALRVLRFVFGKRFDEDEAEGLRIIGLCSYGDLRRWASQGGHEKRALELGGNFDYGVLSKADVGSASKKGLGVPVTKLDGQILTGRLVQHYYRKASLVASFEELLEELVGPVKRGTLDPKDVRELKASGKLFQVSSPEEWEELPEERQLQRILGAEYWYLGSETPLRGEEFAVMVAYHRCMQEDGAFLPGGSLLDILAARLSGDGVVLTANDLWPYFDGGRPAPGTALPQRPQSVLESRKLAKHFAGRLGLPEKVVEDNFTLHHALADYIKANQTAIRRFFGVAEAYLEDEQDILGPDLRLAGPVITGGVGFVVGFVLANFAGLPGEKGSSLFLATALAILGAAFGSRLNVKFGLLEVSWTLLLVLLGTCSAFATTGGVEHQVTAGRITQAAATARIARNLFKGATIFGTIWLAGITFLHWAQRKF